MLLPKRGQSKEFAAMTAAPYAKAAKFSLDGSCVAFVRGGALRQSVIERGASSVWTHYLN